MFWSLSQRVRRIIGKRQSILAAITYAASLAHHGLLGSVENLSLNNVDLTSVPAEYLTSLASSVTESVGIKNVSGCDLVTILDSVKCIGLEYWLGIGSQCLSSEETRALVQAMESHVEWLVLSEEVTLDIRALMEYSGQGKCRGVWCNDDTAPRYRDKLRTWATSKNWIVRCDNSQFIIMINYYDTRYLFMGSWFKGSWVWDGLKWTLNTTSTNVTF